jgi:hypothetical protein
MKPSGVVISASGIGCPFPQLVIVPLIVALGEEAHVGFTLKLKIRVFQSNAALGVSTYSNAPQNVQRPPGQ